MDKRQAHHIWVKFRWLKPIYFLVLALLSGYVCVMALRANNAHMDELRRAVYTADANDTDVQAPLKELQAYVTTHMNTDLATSTSVYPPIQLKHTYERLIKARSDAAAAANSQLYSDAQRFCEQQNSTDFSGRNRVPCIEQYVQSHNPQKPEPVPDALYKFSFASPRWSPDLAGWSLVAAVLFGLLFVMSLVAKQLLRRYSK